MLLVKSIETSPREFYLCFSCLPLKDQLKGLPLFWLPHRVGGKLQGDPGPRGAHQVLLCPMGMRERRIQRASGKFCSPTRIEVLCIDLRSPPANPSPFGFCDFGVHNLSLLCMGIMGIMFLTFFLLQKQFQICSSLCLSSLVNILEDLHRMDIGSGSVNWLLI